MSLVDDISEYLVVQSTAFTILSGTSGNLAKQVALDSVVTPDTLNAVYETPGFGNEYSFSTMPGRARVAMERPSFQILSRSTLYATARTRAQTAYTILDGLAGELLPTSTGTLYIEIVAAQAPFFLQRDDNERYVVATNFNTRKSVVSGAFDLGFDEGFE